MEHITELRMPSSTRRLVQGALWVAGVVFLASLFGIFTRPVGFLASFWPANALLLGMFVRRPSLASPLGWVAAFLAYVIADVVGGDELLIAMVLSICNLVFVGTGFYLYSRLRPSHRKLLEPLSPLYMFGVCVVAALAAAVSAMLVAAPLLPSLMSKGILMGLGYWFSAELVNGILIVPLVLTLPRLWATTERRRIAADVPCEADSVSHALPLLALIATVVLAALMGGPGAIAFPIPALLWCALNYRRFTTIVLTFAVSVWHIIAVSLGVWHISMGSNFLDDTVSLRLGVTLMALGPLTVASVSAARERLLERLREAVDNDYLTGTLSRGAFFQRGEALLREASTASPVGVMMLDIDHFKRVNDENGHAFGDDVLRAFADAVRGALRKGDLFGRLGGEEFAVVLRDSTPQEARVTAERVRAEVAARAVTVEGRTLHITVSIGLTQAIPAQPETLDALLRRADQALYAAKSAGRDRVEVSA